MALSKRKRSSDVSTASDNESTDANNSTVAPADPAPYTLQLLRKGQGVKRQKKEDGKWTSPREEDSPLANGQRIYYKVAPRQGWENMKKYKQFVGKSSIHFLEV